MNAFATLADVETLTGRSFTGEEQTRIGALLPMVSDALRNEALMVGKNLDDMVADNESYANVVKLVTVDIVVRALRQSTEGEPMTQEAQSALNYSWSGTYAIPGGGIAASIMKNDLKRLGLRRQRIGVIDLWHGSME